MGLQTLSEGLWEIKKHFLNVLKYPYPIFLAISSKVEVPSLEICLSLYKSVACPNWLQDRVSMWVVGVLDSYLNWQWLPVSTRSQVFLRVQVLLLLFFLNSQKYISSLKLLGHLKPNLCSLSELYLHLVTCHRRWLNWDYYKFAQIT